MLRRSCKKNLNIHRQDDGVWQDETIFKIWQKGVDTKGFCAIGSSNDFCVTETNRIYKQRNCVEVQFKVRVLKEHYVLLSAIGVYSVHTQDKDVMGARERRLRR